LKKLKYLFEKKLKKKLKLKANEVERGEEIERKIQG